MGNTMEERIKNVMGAVFEMPTEQIKNDSSEDTIESWDSLKHFNLVVALEEEFEFMLTDEEVIQMMNYKLIHEIINEKA